MMESFAVIDGAGLAIVAGLFSSPHCMGMCGPLGCSAFFAGSPQQRDAQWTIAAYHATRAIAYGLFGAIFGLLGAYPIKVLMANPTKLFAGILLLTLFAVIAHTLRWIPRRWHLRYLQLSQKIKALPTGWNGILLGAVTPLIPCGPLYLMLLACAVSGSALKGLEIGLGFALGTIPLLWLTQSQYVRLRPKIMNTHWRWLPHALTSCALLVVVWRMTLHNCLDSWLCN